MKYIAVDYEITLASRYELAYYMLPDVTLYGNKYINQEKSEERAKNTSYFKCYKQITAEIEAFN